MKFVLPPPLKNEDFYTLEDLVEKFNVNRDVVNLMVKTEKLNFPKPVEYGRNFYLKTAVDEWILKHNTYNFSRKQLVELCKGYKPKREGKERPAIVEDERMSYAECFRIFNQRGLQNETD
jgi:predicted DNA-binding transcriptional regulator AlpA